MMFAAWLFVLIFFWSGYYVLTRGRLTRHLGFLHFLIYFFAIYLGSLMLYEDRGALNQRYLLSVILHPILSLAGMFAASFWEKRTFLSDEPLDFPRGQKRLALLWLFFFLAAYAVYLGSLGSEIPLISLFRTRDVYLAHVTRYLSTKGYTGDIAGGLQSLLWISRILIDYFSTFLVVFAFYHSVVRFKKWPFFWVVLAFFLFTALLNNEKYPAVRLLLIAGLCYFNMKNVRVTWKAFLYGGVAFFLGVMALGAVYGIVSGNYLVDDYNSLIGVTLEYGWDMFSDRALVGQGRPLYVLYDIFPGHIDYLWGRSLENPHRLLPYDRVELPYLTCEFIYKFDPQSVCSAPTAFFGEVYANFGLGISFLSMFAFGFVVQWLNSRLVHDFSRFKTPFYIAYFYMIMMYVGDFAISFVTLYFDPRVWFFILLYLMSRWGPFARRVSDAGRRPETAPETYCTS